MKTRTSLERAMTIKTGDFSNIKPSVSISLVHDLEDIGLVYTDLAGILDSLLALETIALSQEMEVIHSHGWGFYKRALERSVDEINNTLQEHIKVLCSVLEEGHRG